VIDDASVSWRSPLQQCRVRERFREPACVHGEHEKAARRDPSAAIRDENDGARFLLSAMEKAPLDARLLCMTPYY
jgi:hypothetical protein